MTDLFYCYAHMTPSDLKTLDTIGGPDYMDGYISDDDLDIPHGTKPPNPEESDILPSAVHPSYPYGNPLSIKHPASRPKRPFEPSSRALFEDMVAGSGLNGVLLWKELGIDGLLPVDEDAEKAAQAESARKMANGAQSQNPPVAHVSVEVDNSDLMMRQNGEQSEDEEEGEVNEEDDEDQEDEDSSEDDLIDSSGANLSIGSIPEF